MRPWLGQTAGQVLGRWGGLVLALGALAVGWWQYGWAGLLMALGAVVFWLLLHFTRMVTVLKRAAARPMGSVASAVMLNAKLRPGVTLLHTTALTRSLGELLSPKDTQPELFRWTDTGGSHVTCTFLSGKLTGWTLFRPPVAEADTPHVAETNTAAVADRPPAP